MSIAYQSNRVRSVFILLFTAIAFPCVAFSQQNELKGIVVKVRDGDTIELISARKVEVIRLLGIDAPERKQPYHQKAKEFMASHCFRKSVRVQTHGRDKYGRWLGDVFLADGTNMNQSMVRSGFAWRYFASKDAILSRLEAEARAARRGLWRDAEPIPPWEFRAERRHR